MVDTWRAARGLGMVLAVACARAPYTERAQFQAIPENQMTELGREAYREILAESRVLRGTPDAGRLEEVGRRIAAAADRPRYDWSFALIDDDRVNAWALPGGYVGVCTGILPVLRSEAGMAFVLGHEVGHAIARHAGERLSQQLGVSGALAVLQAVLTEGVGLSGQESGPILRALGLGAQVGILLPFSREHEKEADIIGLMLMAEAGYPPDEAVGVWQRMGAMAASGTPPVWLSTHPSYEQRQQVIAEWLPEARRRYAPSALDAERTRVAIW